MGLGLGFGLGLGLGHHLLLPAARRLLGLVFGPVLGPVLGLVSGLVLGLVSTFCTPQPGTKRRGSASRGRWLAIMRKPHTRVRQRLKWASTKAWLGFG